MIMNGINVPLLPDASQMTSVEDVARLWVNHLANQDDFAWENSESAIALQSACNRMSLLHQDAIEEVKRALEVRNRMVSALGQSLSRLRLAKRVELDRLQLVEGYAHTADSTTVFGAIRQVIEAKHWIEFLEPRIEKYRSDLAALEAEIISYVKEHISAR